MSIDERFRIKPSKAFPDSKNHLYQKAWMHVDLIFVALLFGLVGIDGLPTFLVIIALLGAAVWHKGSQDQGFSHLEVRQELDPLADRPGFEGVSFRKADGDFAEPEVKSFLPPYLVVLPARIFQKSDEYVRSIIAHERVHATRHDPVTTLIFEHVSKFVGPVILFGLPLTACAYLFNIITLIEALSMFVVLMYTAPALYFYFQRSQYRYRREFIADAEAAYHVGTDYLDFIVPATQFDAAMKNVDEVTQHSKIPFVERWKRINGEHDIPGRRFFMVGLLGGLSIAFAIFQAMMSLRYQVGDDPSSFAPDNVFVCIFIFCIWLLNILRLTLLFSKNSSKNYLYRYKILGLLGTISGGFISGVILSIVFFVIPNSPKVIISHSLMKCLELGFLFSAGILAVSILLFMNSLVSSEDPFRKRTLLVVISAFFVNFAFYNEQWHIPNTLVMQMTVTTIIVCFSWYIVFLVISIISNMVKKIS